MLHRTSDQIPLRCRPDEKVQFEPCPAVYGNVLAMILPHLSVLARCALLACLGSMASVAMAVEQVKVGAAHFPPYVVAPEGGPTTGLLLDVVEALNRVQAKYQFVIVPTSLPRRFRDLQQGRVDLSLFENPGWGWQGVPHVSVDLGLEDAEVFVAKRIDGREQSYFRHLDGKRLALFNGYHYAFAQFNADPQYLAEHYSATLTYSHDSNLMMVMRDRADIALVTRSYLTDFMMRHPEIAPQLLVSDRIDQIYHHQVILRPEAPLSGEALQGLLQQLRDNGEMARIFQPYRVVLVPIAGPAAPGTALPDGR
jgi:ABC-type amino acid transport substrate-binding protein